MHITIKNGSTVSITVSDANNPTEAGRICEDALATFLAFSEKHPEFKNMSIY